MVRFKPTICWSPEKGSTGHTDGEEYTSLTNNYLSKQPHSLNIHITKGFLFEEGVFYVASTRLLIKIHTPNEFLAPLLVNMITWDKSSKLGSFLIKCKIYNRFYWRGSKFTFLLYFSWPSRLTEGSFSQIQVLWNYICKASYMLCMQLWLLGEKRQKLCLKCPREVHVGLYFLRMSILERLYLSFLGSSDVMLRAVVVFVHCASYSFNKKSLVWVFQYIFSSRHEGRDNFWMYSLGIW